MNAIQQTAQMAALVSIGQLQGVLYETVARKQNLFIDPDLVGMYPPQLTEHLNRAWSMVDSAYAAEDATVWAAQNAAYDAINSGALSESTVGDSSGLLDFGPGTPRLAINAPTAQAMVQGGYWTDANAATLEQFRAALNDFQSLQTATEYWVVDFANYARNHGTAPTWEYLTNLYPVPTQTASASGSGIPGWLWIALGLVAFAFGA